MKRTKGKGKIMEMQGSNTVRASISFPPGLYETLEEIAKQKKVSLAWVVRDASEKYVSDQASKSKQGKRELAPGTGKLTRRTS